MENIERKPSQRLVLTDVHIPYNTENWQPRNFSGAERVANNRIMNAKGSRNFCVFLNPEKVDCEKLIADGWNVKKSVNPNDPLAEPSYMLRVKVKYHPENSDLRRLNPVVRVCTTSSEMMMDESNIGDLDSAQIMKANMTINATWSSTNTYTGYVAYLSKLVVRVYEEEGSLDDLMAGIYDDTED